MKDALESNKLEKLSTNLIINGIQNRQNENLVSVNVDSPVFFEKSVGRVPDKSKNIQIYKNPGFRRPNFERCESKIERAFSGRPDNRKSLLQQEPEPEQERPSSRIMAAFSKKIPVYKTKVPAKSTTRTGPMLDLTSPKTPPIVLNNKIHNSHISSLKLEIEHGKYKGNDEDEDEEGNLKKLRLL
jgi:hypothetical protein